MASARCKPISVSVSGGNDHSSKKSTYFDVQNRNTFASFLTNAEPTKFSKVGSMSFGMSGKLKNG